MLFSPKPAVALHLIQKIKSNFGGGGVKHEYEISINKNKIFNEFDIGEIIIYLWIYFSFPFITDYSLKTKAPF
jgi:hypothetical protein